MFNVALTLPKNNDEAADWLSGELMAYVGAVSYMAYFVEARAAVGDVTTEEIMQEFSRNISAHMREGFNEHNPQ
jgi:hypothetical protein